jgi:branched-subunit amino acid aminotransferase/4-amino-4-deoxychorismate lyase
MKIWFNGRIVPASSATVAATDPAVQHGLGVFEVTRAYDGVPYLLDRHLARLRRSASRFGLKVRTTDAALARGAEDLLEAGRLKSAYVRIVLTGGGALMILATPLPRIPASWYSEGAAVDFAPWRRDPAGPLFGHKTLNYLENVLTRERARSTGLADLLYLSTEGHVLEGTVTNVFMVSGGRLRTPALEGILPGVTRDEVMRLAREMKIPVDEAHLLPKDLLAADEAFLTNALIEVMPVSRVGRFVIGGPGRLTSALASRYRLSSP